MSNPDTNKEVSHAWRRAKRHSALKTVSYMPINGERYAYYELVQLTDAGKEFLQKNGTVPVSEASPNYREAKADEIYLGTVGKCVKGCVYDRGLMPWH